MDVGTTISEVRKEYEDFLREKHPEWAENTVKTHVSDAFYIWNNTLLPSFWKMLIDEESMEIGRQAIYSYLKDDLLSDNAEVRAKAYFADLSIFALRFQEILKQIKRRQQLLLSTHIRMDAFQ